MPFEIDRSLYARMYGPTVGDRVRLGDTNLPDTRLASIGTGPAASRSLSDR